MVTRDIRRNKSFGNLNYEYNTYIHTYNIRTLVARILHFFIFSNIEMKNDVVSMYTFCAFSKVAPFGGGSRHATGIFATPTKIRRRVSIRMHTKYKYRQYDCSRTLSEGGKSAKKPRFLYPLDWNSTNSLWALRNMKTRDFLQFPVT